MPLFRRKTDKGRAPPDVRPRQSGSLKRTPSTKSRDLANGTISQGQILSEEELSREKFECINRTTSQFCKSLQEILHDKNSLGYFIQFLEARKAGQLIRFWLDAESFQASTWSRIRTHSLNAGKKRRQTSNESDKNLEPSSCQPAPVLIANQHSCQISPDEVKHFENYETFAEHFPNNNSVINNSAKETDLQREVTQVTSSGEKTQNKLLSGEMPQNVQNLTLNFNEKSLSDSANVLNQKHSTTPDSEVFPEPQDKGSTVRRQPRNDSSQNWADKLKKSIENDAVRIFTKYLSKDATDPIGVDDVLRSQCISKICREDGEVDPKCFVDCQEFAVSKMESEHFPSYNGSEYHLKCQIDLVTSGPIYLTDFLFYDPAFFYFMEFMEQEGGKNILQFWLAVENFEKHLKSQESGYDGMEAQADAMVLYDKYFSLQASHPLGFDDKCRFEVEGNICREEGPLPDCFAKSREMVLKTIEKIYFSEFRHSEIFYKFLSELVGTVHSSRELPKQRKRTDSDASEGSTHSAESVRSTRNTLLATGTSLGRAMHKFENDMNIDPSLLNPDLLWKRESPKMEIGKVDDFGQYMSEFDPQPDTEKSKGSLFFKRRKDKEKEEEEMAIKIAQMIINDVTSVTQTIGAMKSESFSDKPES